MQPPQQRKRRTEAVLGEQHPGQHQILRLPRVARLVIRAEAAFFHPAGGRGDLALGQQQPGPLRRDGVEQAGRARRDQPGLAHRRQGPGRITVGLPDPRQGSQASGQRLGVGEPPAQRDSLSDMLERGVELVPLVGHLAQAHLRNTGGGQGRPARWCGDLKGLLVGAERRVQPTPGTLDLAEVMAAPGGQGELAGLPPLGDARREGALSFGQTTA